MKNEWLNKPKEPWQKNHEIDYIKIAHEHEYIEEIIKALRSEVLRIYTEVGGNMVIGGQLAAHAIVGSYCRGFHPYHVTESNHVIWHHPMRDMPLYGCDFVTDNVLLIKHDKGVDTVELKGLNEETYVGG